MNARSITWLSFCGSYLLMATCEVSKTVADEVFPVAIRVDADVSLGELKPIWRFFGADEPNYATMKNGKKLLAELGQLAPQQVYFRTHNLLCSGDGTPAFKWGSTGVYRQDTDGKPIYDWTICRWALRHVPGPRRAAVRANWLHAERSLDAARAVST
jgi:hypothetical protein